MIDKEIVEIVLIRGLQNFDKFEIMNPILNNPIKNI